MLRKVPDIAIGARLAVVAGLPAFAMVVFALVLVMTQWREQERLGQLHRLALFGIIKSGLGFRQCLLRGLYQVRGEWNLVTVAWNTKRIFVLVGAN